MGKPYSDDLRERVVEALETGQTRVEVAELFSLSLSSVGRFIRRKRETGSVSPEKFGGYKRFALEPHEELVRQLVEEQPDSSLPSFRGAWPRKRLWSVRRQSFGFCVTLG